MTIEGSPYLAGAHLAVFDLAKPLRHRPTLYPPRADDPLRMMAGERMLLNPRDLKTIETAERRR